MAYQDEDGTWRPPHKLGPPEATAEVTWIDTPGVPGEGYWWCKLCNKVATAEHIRSDKHLAWYPSLMFQSHWNQRSAQTATSHQSNELSATRPEFGAPWHQCYKCTPPCPTVPPAHHMAHCQPPTRDQRGSAPPAQQRAQHHHNEPSATSEVIINGPDGKPRWAAYRNPATNCVWFWDKMHNQQDNRWQIYRSGHEEYFYWHPLMPDFSVHW